MEPGSLLTDPEPPAADAVPVPSTPVLVVEHRPSQDQPDFEDIPASLTPLTAMAPSHAGLPIGRSRSISSVSRNRSDSVTSHGHSGLSLGTNLPSGGSPGPSPTRPTLPGGAAALIIPNNPSRISIVSNGAAVSPISPTQSSSTHVGNVLAPASFFRPARPSQQGQHHLHSTVSSQRSLPHSIGPTPTGTTSPRASLALPSRPPIPGMSPTASPRKNGAIPDSAIPLTSFAARRQSTQSKRISHGSTSASDMENDVFGTMASNPIAEDGQHARPMASREPLLTPFERAEQQPSSPQGVRHSIERMFRRSFSGESLKQSPNVGSAPPVPDTKDGRPASRHPRFAPLPPRAPVHSTVVSPAWMAPLVTDSGRPLRNYEMHPGANKFFLRGRLMLGGDPPYAFLGTLFVYCFFAGWWMGTTCVYWWHNISPALAIIGAYMCLLTLASLLASAFRDPGILPRDLDLEAPLPIGGDSDTPLPREIRVRDEIVRTKYCVTCKTYRPPRSSHCRNCDNCVDGCDHHCPWINNCVGRRNYGSFITCLVSAVLSLILIAITSAVHLNVLSSREHLDFEHTLREGFGGAVTFVAACILIWPVSILLSYHLRVRVTFFAPLLRRHPR
ncbi:zf-DHHC-domain-containing protein [Exidia glandulosa HHB12029]|uniref:Palmitoyltransferase n=1 Tax=Exidia glandulosa HHB12029 TaxID=1314781 RepID=A0A165EHD4_EXIGL|nr:zf-DHHC-domain-containing protein [Exidia glandulosa HHB12029]